MVAWGPLKRGYIDRGRAHAAARAGGVPFYQYRVGRGGSTARAPTRPLPRLARRRPTSRANCKSYKIASQIGLKYEYCTSSSSLYSGRHTWLRSHAGRSSVLGHPPHPLAPPPPQHVSRPSRCLFENAFPCHVGQKGKDLLGSDDSALRACITSLPPRQAARPARPPDRPPVAQQAAARGDRSARAARREGGRQAGARRSPRESGAGGALARPQTARQARRPSPPPTHPDPLSRAGRRAARRFARPRRGGGVGRAMPRASQPRLLAARRGKAARAGAPSFRGVCAHHGACVCV